MKQWLTCWCLYVKGTFFLMTIDVWLVSCFFFSRYSNKFLVLGSDRIIKMILETLEDLLSPKH